jgi:hypothetical protein
MLSLAGPEAPEAHGEQAASLDQPSNQPPALDRVDPFPAPLDWPPFPEPPGTQAANAHAPPREPPSLAGSSEPAAGASASPFPAPPAWPPFHEPPGGEAGLSPPEPSGLPPYIELPAHPERGEEHAEPAGQAPFAEPPSYAPVPPFGPWPSPFPEASDATAATPPFGGPRRLPTFAEPTAATALPEPREVAGFPGFDPDRPALDPATGTSAEATAKIAAQANATAQVLDNLQRLLSKTVSPAPSAPQPQPVRPHDPPHSPHSAAFHRPRDPMPFTRERAPMLPLPVPPPERTGSKKVYLLGFFTGLVLSVMAGAALFFLINTG